MKPVTSPEHFSFTNRFGGPHFKKSLLKTRIEMMNKANSQWRGIGNYFAFVGMLWLCAAFTKPYREEVAAKIVEKMPDLKQVLVPEAAPKAVFNDFVLEEPVIKHQKDSVKTVAVDPTIIEADTQKLSSSTKYVVYTPNKLHLLITPKTTFEDLVKIRHELDRHGLSLEVLAWQLDSLGRYVRKAEVIVRGYSSTPKLITRGSDLLNKPISPIAVILQLKQMKFRQENVTMNIFGETPAEKSLKELVLLDKEFANFDVRWSQSVYEIYLKNRQKGFYNVPITVFSAKSLLKEDNLRFQRAFAIVTDDAQKEVLRVNSSLKNAKFRLNDNPAFLADIEDIPPDKFIKAVKYEVYDDKKAVSEIYMLVYTKQ